MASEPVGATPIFFEGAVPSAREMSDSGDRWQRGPGPSDQDDTQRQERPVRQQPPPHPDGDGTADPVQENFGDREDLYEIATWEVRSLLDRVAFTLSNGVDASKRVLLVGIGMLFLVGQVAVVSLFVLEVPLLGVLSALSLLPALVLAGTFWTSDPTLREPLVLLVATFLLAIVFASFAAVVNSAVLPFFELVPIVGLPLFFFLVVGPIEEFVKWLAIRAHAYRSGEFNTVVDGAVYGAVAGLGFAAIENIVYIVFFSMDGAGAGAVIQRQYAISIAVTRSFVGPGHVIFSAWAGFYLGLAKFNPEYGRAIVIKGLLIAAFIHATYNTLVTVLPLSVLPFIALVVVYHSFWFGMLYRKIAAYHSYYRTLTPAQ